MPNQRYAMSLLALGLFATAAIALGPTENTRITTEPKAGSERPATPDEAIAELVAGNKRYQAGKNESTNPVEARTSLAAGQAPFAAVIRCADSRVAPEIVFDQPLGQLFVCGVALVVWNCHVGGLGIGNGANFCCVQLLHRDVSSEKNMRAVSVV